MKLIAKHQDVEIFSYGSDLDGIISKGSQVQVSTRTAQTMRDAMSGNSVNRSQNKDACEFVYQSEVTQQNCIAPAISMANFFPVDRRAGMASAIQMNMVRANVPVMPQIICCPTDIPLMSPNIGSKCKILRSR